MKGEGCRGEGSQGQSTVMQDIVMLLLWNIIWKTGTSTQDSPYQYSINQIRLNQTWIRQFSFKSSIPQSIKKEDAVIRSSLTNDMFNILVNSKVHTSESEFAIVLCTSRSSFLSLTSRLFLSEPLED